MMRRAALRNTKRSARAKSSVEQRITSRLEGFVDALKAGKEISKHFTCRTVVLELEPAIYDSAKVVMTRQLLGASQAVFAQFLGVSPNAVRAWEQDLNSPSDIACRFMDEIRINPQYWRKRLRESARTKLAS
jgi:putative transcriptional regulator